MASTKGVRETAGVIPAAEIGLDAVNTIPITITAEKKVIQEIDHADEGAAGRNAESLNQSPFAVIYTEVTSLSSLCCYNLF